MVMTRFKIIPAFGLKRNALTTLVRIFVLAAFLVTAIQIPAVEAGRQDFTFVNYSGRTIYRLYVSRSDHSGWEEDLLGNGVLRHGEYRNIHFSNSETGRFWDIKAEFQDGTYWRWDGIDLQTVSKVTVDGSRTITKS